MSFKEFDWKGQTYRVSKPIIYVLVAVVTILCVWALSFNPSGKPLYYVTCTQDICSNFFFNNSDHCGVDIALNDSLCTTPFLFNGSSKNPVYLGVTPPWIISNFLLIVILLLVIFALVNHFLYNKDFKFGDA